MFLFCQQQESQSSSAATTIYGVLDMKSAWLINNSINISRSMVKCEDIHRSQDKEFTSWSVPQSWQSTLPYWRCGPTPATVDVLSLGNKEAVFVVLCLRESSGSFRVMASGSSCRGRSTASKSPLLNASIGRRDEIWPRQWCNCFATSSIEVLAAMAR